jgi:hypothetical protein
MELFNFETLNLLLNQQIQLKDGNDHLVQLHVDKVSLPRFPSEEYEAFSVDLSSAAEVHCPSGNYLFSHPSFGEVQLFMSPYAADKYQIVVSRKKK